MGIPQICKDYITNYNASNAYKEGLAMAYNRYAVCFKLKWEIPYFQKEERLPNVPSVEEANIIISSFSRKWATIFTILKETGLRPIELHRTSLKNIDLEKGTINAKSCKRGNARILKITDSTLAMLRTYITENKSKNLFPKPHDQCKIWTLGRNRTAKKLNRPELIKYRLYDLRHHFATMLYHKTKDILLVKQQLGHKKIEHTLIYTHLFNFKTDEYISRTVQLGTPTTLKEICELAEAGFTKFTEIEGYQIFKKPK
ncbi:MAG: site-specific integrase [Candidatus Bathyarchaeota archaeon]|nr:site-specific integrase [Candidatus Bathyarchaeota archaeon]